MFLENVKEPETLDPLLLGRKPSTLKVSQQSGSPHGGSAVWWPGEPCLAV